MTDTQNSAATAEHEADDQIAVLGAVDLHLTVAGNVTIRTAEDLDSLPDGDIPGETQIDILGVQEMPYHEEPGSINSLDQEDGEAPDETYAFGADNNDEEDVGKVNVCAVNGVTMSLEDEDKLKLRKERNRIKNQRRKALKRKKAAAKLMEEAEQNGGTKRGVMHVQVGHAKDVASPESLQKLISAFNADKGEQRTRLHYVVFNSGRQLISFLDRVPAEHLAKYQEQHPNLEAADAKRLSHKHAVDVLINPMNCIHAFHGPSRVLAEDVPNLKEVDSTSDKNSSKLGNFTMVEYLPESTKVKKHVFNLYVQFGFGEPRRKMAAEDPNFCHLRTTAVRKGLRNILSMFEPNTKIGIILFGDDTARPTDWPIVEEILESICESRNCELTVFIPSKALVNPNRQLGKSIIEAVRSQGYSIT